MAYTPYNWQNDVSELSAENFNHIEEGLNRNQNVELIAVSSSAPTEYSVGDKYYNTELNMIYTAIENGWTNAEYPIRGAFYLVLSEQNTYYYNGEELISVGGGSGGGDTLPIASIVPYTGDTAPSGWLICDGTAVSRTTYKSLFDVIGTTYGNGDGTTTFNLPNLKGKVLVGKDSSDSDFNTLGKTGGEKTHTLTSNEMPSHTHGIYSQGGDTQTGQGWVARAINGKDAQQIMTDTILNTGGDQAHNNLQPYLVGNYIIKYEQTIVVDGTITTTYSESTTDTYSCSYVNNLINGGTGFVKYDDGTAICWGRKNGSTTLDDWWGFAKRSPEGNSALSQDFPITFSDSPIITINGEHGYAIFSVSLGSVSTTNFTFTFYKPGAISNGDYAINYIAIGKWK